MKWPGNILLAAMLVLVMGACGPEQEASTDGDAGEGAVEESAELELVELPKPVKPWATGLRQTKAAGR